MGLVSFRKENANTSVTEGHRSKRLNTQNQIALAYISWVALLICNKQTSSLNKHWFKGSNIIKISD